jgi:hypothetical protein
MISIATLYSTALLVENVAKIVTFAFNPTIMSSIHVVNFGRVASESSLGRRWRSSERNRMLVTNFGESEMPLLLHFNSSKTAIIAEVRSSLNGVFSVLS